MAETERAERCALCERRVPSTTRHHLIPRARHRTPRTRRLHNRARLHETIDLCGPCHKQVHAVISEKELERNYASVERLRSHPQMARFLVWIRSKPGDLRVAARRKRRA